jgi:hypothetical protein
MALLPYHEVLIGQVELLLALIVWKFQQNTGITLSPFLCVSTGHGWILVYWYI